MVLQEQYISSAVRFFEASRSDACISLFGLHFFGSGVCFSTESATISAILPPFRHHRILRPTLPSLLHPRPLCFILGHDASLGRPTDRWATSVGSDCFSTHYSLLALRQTGFSFLFVVWRVSLLFVPVLDTG